jgi:23S rRNA (uracil1939-C5)-methyltransferase
MTWESGSVWTVEIKDVGYGGAGVGRVDGKVVMAQGLLPGEVAEVRIVRDHGRYAEGAAVRLLTASPQRVDPVCPLALRVGADGPVCPGCRYQHATPDAEIALKLGQLRALLTRHARQPDVEILPPVVSPAPLAYRNKIVVHLRQDVEPRALGYYAEDNTTIIDVPRCPLAVEPLNALLGEVRADPEALAAASDGAAVTFRHTPCDGALWWRGTAPREQAPDLTEDSPAGPLTVPRGSFFQVNPAVADRLVRETAARLTVEPSDNLIDLYCGVGVFALAAASGGPRTVFGVDSDPRAIEAAGRNAAALRVGNVRWVRAAAGPGLRRVRSLMTGRASVLVDPPRAGLGRALVSDLAALKPDRILYVSCAADTLARDAAWFLEDGYRLASAALFDMFPRTAHFETLAELRPVGSGPRRASGT